MLQPQSSGIGCCQVTTTLAREPLWRAIRRAPECSDKRPRRAADFLLRRFEISGPPVPVETIAERLGVNVTYQSDLEWAGVIDSKAEPVRIRINFADHPVRRRFTLAHELGHLLLHPIGESYRDRAFGPTGSKQERAANEFAASLLIPLWILEPMVLGTTKDSKELAALFYVSVPAMEVQLGKLL